MMESKDLAIFSLSQKLRAASDELKASALSLYHQRAYESGAYTEGRHSALRYAADELDAALGDVRAELERLKESRDWEAALKKALLPYQERAVKAEAQLLAVSRERDDYRECYEDAKRLARKIDVALHGEEGAAQAPSLCDLVGPAGDLREQLATVTRERDEWQKRFSLQASGGWLSPAEAEKLHQESHNTTAKHLRELKAELAACVRERDELRQQVEMWKKGVEAWRRHYYAGNPMTPAEHDPAKHATTCARLVPEDDIVIRSFCGQYVYNPAIACTCGADPNWKAAAQELEQQLAEVTRAREALQQQLEAIRIPLCPFCHNDTLSVWTMGDDRVGITCLACEVDFLPKPEAARLHQDGKP